jgi:hypothetical protein
MRLRTPWLPIIMLALAGCGNEVADIPVAPQLFTDRDGMGFNTEFGSGTFIGQTAFNSLTIENRGQETLELTDFSLSGPAVFTLKPPEGFTPGTPLRLETYDRAFVEVAFKPTDDIEYRGTLIIKSNAANTPTKEIELMAKGVNP